MYLTNKPLSKDNASDKHVFFVVNPYKVFTFNDNTYLMFGKEMKNTKIMKSFIVSYREIRDIYDVEILGNRNYCPIESFEPFKDGINQAKLNRDPFGYIRQKENEPVQIEIVSSNEYTVAKIKEKLKKEFNEDVEFAHKGNRKIAYIYGDKEKCMKFLFWYSDVCIVTGPEEFKKHFKSKLMRTFLKYDGHKKNYSNMMDFIDNDDYIEKAHLSMDAENEARAKKNNDNTRKRKKPDSEPDAERNVRSFVKKNKKD